LDIEEFISMFCGSFLGFRHCKHFTNPPER
jgi:hypothetical protein